MTLRPFLAAILLAATPAPPPASAAPQHVLAVTIEITYDPVRTLGCHDGRTSWYGTAVDAGTGVVLPFTFEAQNPCSNLFAEAFCGEALGAVQGYLCGQRTAGFMNLSGHLILDGHTHPVLRSSLAWVPTSVPSVTATATGTVVLG